MVPNNEIFSIIEETLGLAPGSVSLDSNNKNISEWDSLGHFAILSAIDEKYSDISVVKPDIAKASSVKELIDYINA